MSHTLIIHCGGTLGMVASTDGLCNKRGHILELLQKSNKISKFSYDIVELDLIIDSSKASMQDWIKIIVMIENMYHRYDGFVIIHGTDTMAYASSFISYMVRIPKPIVFTGAIVPMQINYESGETNIFDSIKIAQTYEGGVFLQFGGTLFSGNRVTKISTISETAFVGSYKPIPIANNIEFTHKYSHGVSILKLYPNILSSLFEFILKNSTGLIIETYGSGNGLDGKHDVLEMIAEYTKRGKIIINVSQCLTSKVDSTYTASLGLKKAGVLCGNGATTEAAFAILAFTLENFDILTQRDKVIELLKDY